MRNTILIWAEMKMKWIDRDNCMDFLFRNRGRYNIKVVSGVRRCGKSTLFSLSRKRLLQMAWMRRQFRHEVNAMRDMLVLQGITQQVVHVRNEAIFLDAALATA